MKSEQFDLVTVGGGIGASALAIAMAREGARVLVIEKEQGFRDRVRGEYLAPWGVAEAKELGIADLLMRNCAKEVPWVEMGFGPRNVAETTPQKMSPISYCHPEMQEVLLAAAVQSIEANANRPVVTVRNGKDERIEPRLVVGADGRGSGVRKWANFPTQKNVQHFQFAGVLLTGVIGRDDLVTFLFNPDLGLVVATIPQAKQRWRAYLGYPVSSGIALQGSEKLKTFLAESGKVAPGVQQAYAKVESIGPLASFEAGESWVDHPYRDGVALIGDAAGTNDPTFGQGMPMTLRDARVLRDALRSHSDWDRAGHEYARQHDQYFQNSRQVCGWLRTLFQDPGPEAQTLRQRAMPKIAEDQSRVPDQL